MVDDFFGGGALIICEVEPTGVAAESLFSPLLVPTNTVYDVLVVYREPGPGRVHVDSFPRTDLLLDRGSVHSSPIDAANRISDDSKRRPRKSSLAAAAAGDRTGGRSTQ